MDSKLYMSKLFQGKVTVKRNIPGTEPFSYETIIYRNDGYYDVIHETKLVNTNDVQYEVSPIKWLFPKETGSKVIAARKIQKQYKQYK